MPRMREQTTKDWSLSMTLRFTSCHVIVADRDKWHGGRSPRLWWMWETPFSAYPVIRLREIVRFEPSAIRTTVIPGGGGGSSGKQNQKSIIQKNVPDRRKEFSQRPQFLFIRGCTSPQLDVIVTRIVFQLRFLLYRILAPVSPSDV